MTLKSFYRAFILLASFVAVSSECPASVPKRLYIAPDDHTDYMWTADEATYRDAILSMLDYYVELNDSTSSEKYPYMNKWNCDGSYWLYIYRTNRSKEQFERLMRQVKEGRITAPLNSLESVMGVAPLEAILRDMYYAGSLQREYDVDFPMATNMEDQVLPWGLSSLWAGSGARYSWRGVCSCVTSVPNLDKRKNELYWYTGPDGRRVLMKWYSVDPEMIAKPNVFRYNLGKYLEADHVPNAIKDMKALMADRERYPYDAAAAFGMGGDNLKTLRDDYLRIARDSSDTEYQVIISNELDFFRDVEKNYGRSLPSESISYGSTEWGTAIASMAELSAKVKRSIEKLRAAELMYAIVTRHDPSFGKELDQARRDAWFACGLYFEHDWTADNPDLTRKQRADWERKMAACITEYVDRLYDMSLERMGELLGRKDGEGETFFVLNPLGWERSDVCDIPCPEGNFCAVDLSDGSTVLSQYIVKEGVRYLRIYARDIPSLGYKMFSLRPAGGSESGERHPFVFSSDGLESDIYRIRVNVQGVVTGIVDKRSGRELVSDIDGLMANDLGKAKRAKGLHGDNLVLESCGPVSATLLSRSYFPLKHTTRITLYAESDRIDIDNVIHENFGNNLTTYAFSFNMENPWIRTEEAGAIVDVRQQSDGGDYADDICRLDWVAFNHFADIHGDGDYGVTLSNRDALFMKTGNSSIVKLDCDTPQIRVLVGGKVNSWLGVDYQDGCTEFHNSFSLKSYDGNYDAAGSMRFSLEHQNPLVPGRVYSKGDGRMVAPVCSLCEVSDGNVIVWCVKPCEDGADKGLVVRLWNVSDEDRECEIKVHSAGFSQAYLATHIETEERPLKLRNGVLYFNMGHNRIETFIFK